MRPSYNILKEPDNQSSIALHSKVLGCCYSCVAQYRHHSPVCTVNEYGHTAQANLPSSQGHRTWSRTCSIWHPTVIMGRMPYLLVMVHHTLSATSGQYSITLFFIYSINTQVDEHVRLQGARKECVCVCVFCPSQKNSFQWKRVQLSQPHKRATAECVLVLRSQTARGIHQL